MRDAPRTSRAPGRGGAALVALILAATVVAAVAGGWTSRAEAGSRLWAANPYVKLQEPTRPAPWKAALVAPRGGRTSFQVVDLDERVRLSCARSGRAAKSGIAF